MDTSHRCLAGEKKDGIWSSSNLSTFVWQKLQRVFIQCGLRTGLLAWLFSAALFFLSILFVFGEVCWIHQSWWNASEYLPSFPGVLPPIWIEHYEEGSQGCMNVDPLTHQWHFWGTAWNCIYQQYCFFPPKDLFLPSKLEHQGSFLHRIQEVLCSWVFSFMFVKTELMLLLCLAEVWKNERNYAETPPMSRWCVRQADADVSSRALFLNASAMFPWIPVVLF